MTIGVEAQIGAQFKEGGAQSENPINILVKISQAPIIDLTVHLDIQTSSTETFWNTFANQQNNCGNLSTAESDYATGRVEWLPSVHKPYNLDISLTTSLLCWESETPNLPKPLDGELPGLCRYDPMIFDRDTCSKSLLAMDIGPLSHAELYNANTVTPFTAREGSLSGKALTQIAPGFPASRVRGTQSEPPRTLQPLSPTAPPFIPSSFNSFQILETCQDSEELLVEQSLNGDRDNIDLLNCFSTSRLLKLNALEDVAPSGGEPALYTHSEGESTALIDSKLEPCRFSIPSSSIVSMPFPKLSKGKPTSSPSHMVTRSRARQLAEGRRKTPIRGVDTSDEDEESFFDAVVLFALHAAVKGDSSVLLGTRVDAVVAQDGSGQFRTIGEAIKAAAPEKSERKFVIYVKAGVYYEKVVVGEEKTNLTIIGAGMDATIPCLRKTSQPTTLDSTTRPDPPWGKRWPLWWPATGGPFTGARYRDTSTLFAQSNRQYFRDCAIYGTVDFIFGDSAAVFQNCAIRPRTPLPGQFNAITAQGRRDPGGKSGFSFQNCDVSPAEDLAGVRTFLGRPWKSHCRVVFSNTYMAGFIDRRGWAAWSGDDDSPPPPDTIYYAEFGNYGPGADTASRVRWKGLHLGASGSAEARTFSADSFIEASSWILPEATRMITLLNPPSAEGEPVEGEENRVGPEPEGREREPEVKGRGIAPELLRNGMAPELENGVVGSEPAGESITAPEPAVKGNAPKPAENVISAPKSSGYASKPGNGICDIGMCCGNKPLNIALLLLPPSPRYSHFDFW
ncbi:unnamed protein product [Cuscuta campestris]|uniref:pectinesterase n=1 Tax=Cuscuta campestris TaxID=132261 RepID=A0A484NE31_9ASTE|nr:unnamed protein product [Cuscuta campestris]